MPQRLRITYHRGDAVKYITHLDVMRFWERAFRRAHLPLAMSQGFHPHPRLSVAAPLPVGVTSDAEVMDVYLDETLRPEQALQRLAAKLVPGFTVVEVAQVPEEAPSVQSLVRFAEYLVTVETGQTVEEVERATRLLLAKTTLPWELTRDSELRQYDLRPQIADLWLAKDTTPPAGALTLGMRLQNDTNAAGRPEQVARALGFEAPPLSVHRTRLILDRPPARPAPRPQPPRRRYDADDPRHEQRT